MACGAARVEVGQLTLGLCGDELGREGNADAFPSLVVGGEEVGCALIPHALARGEGVGHGRVELLLVDEQVVGLGGVAGTVLHDDVAVDGARFLHGNGAVGFGLAFAVSRVDKGRRDGVVGLGLGRGGTVGIRRGVDEQVLCQVDITEEAEAVVVEHGREEETVGLQALLIVAVAARDIAIAASEVDGRHVGISFVSFVGRLRCEYGIGVVVGRAHLLALEVGRCAVDTVDACRSGGQAAAFLIDVRRQILMRTCGNVSVGKRLSEEDVVVGPDGIVLGSLFKVFVETDIGAGRYGTAGIDEVAIGEAILDVAVLAGC